MWGSGVGANIVCKIVIPDELEFTPACTAGASMSQALVKTPVKAKVKEASIGIDKNLMIRIYSRDRLCSIADIAPK